MGCSRLDCLLVQRWKGSSEATGCGEPVPGAGVAWGSTWRPTWVHCSPPGRPPGARQRPELKHCPSVRAAILQHPQRAGGGITGSPGSPGTWSPTADLRCPASPLEAPGLPLVPTEYPTEPNQK
eukprot:jgi/Botrbrau1/1737/Bobra.116_2s0077.1